MRHSHAQPRPAHASPSARAHSNASAADTKLQRSTHRTAHALNTDIRNGITTCNDNPKPYIPAKTAHEILDSVANYRSRINDSGHCYLRF